MKRLILIFAFTSVGIGVSGKTMSHSVDVVLPAYGVRLAEDSMIVDLCIGLGYRGIYYPRNTGFYCGVDLTAAFPVLPLAEMYNWMNSFYDHRIDIFFGSLKFPIGYREPGEGSKSGFYGGGGPLVQITVAQDAPSVMSMGVFGEIGRETNRTDRGGFHISVQFGWSPLVIAGSELITGGTGAFEFTLRFGYTWFRIWSKP